MSFLASRKSSQVGNLPSKRESFVVPASPLLEKSQATETAGGIFYQLMQTSEIRMISLFTIFESRRSEAIAKLRLLTEDMFCCRLSEGYSSKSRRCPGKG
jgi:hypothetical protein